MTGWPLTSCFTLTALPNAPAWARRLAGERIAAWGLRSIEDIAELLISELVTNSIKVMGGLDPDAWKRYEAEPLSISYEEIAALKSIQLRLCSDHTTLLIEVWDSSDQPPVMSLADQDSESGRGLFLVDQLAKQWSFYFPASGGKVVWCELVVCGGDA